MMLMALFAPWAANAQTPASITLNDGGSTNQYIPVFGGWNDCGSRNQFVIPATDLSDMQWSSINKLTFHCVSASYSLGATEYAVYMKEVGYTTFDSPTFEDWSSMSVVYSGTITISNYAMVITLSTPFNYTNGNLIIGFHQTVFSSYFSYPKWYGVNQESGVNTAIYQKADYAHTWNGVITYQQFLPKITIEYTPDEAPSCLPPVCTPPEVISSQEVELKWIPNGTEADWKLQYKKASDSEFTTVHVNETDLDDGVFTLSGLTANTEYDWKVAAWCDPSDDNSISLYIDGTSFITNCDVITTYPWTEDFDSYAGTTSGSANNLPNCYNYYNGTTGIFGGYPLIYNGNSCSHSGSNCLYFYSYRYSSSYTFTKLYAILPEMENLNGKWLTLYAKALNESSSFTVGMMTDPDDIDTFIPLPNGVVSPSSSDYEEYIFVLREGNYVAIMMPQGDVSQNIRGIYIDDITIDNPPSCIKPTNLDVTGFGTTATVTWESDATQWQVAHATSDLADPNENIVAIVNTQSYSMHDLPDGDHYFWVRTLCAPNDQSVWAGPTSVHIGYCVPSPTEVYGDGISNVTFGSDGYVVNNNTHPTVQPFYADYTDQIGKVQAGVESTIAITYATGYPYYTYVWVDLDNSFSFDDNELVAFGYSTTANPSVLTLTFTIPATQTSGDFRMRIGSTVNNWVHYPANNVSCTSEGNGFFEDYTLRVIGIPPCEMPYNLALTENETTITASWEGVASAYNIDINGTVTNNVTSPYTFSVVPGTYTVKVQAACEAGNVSEWTDAVSTTIVELPACNTPTDFTIAYDGDTEASFSWTSDATTWNINVNGTVTSITENSYTLTNLEPYDIYVVKVQAACSGGRLSDWSEPIRFITGLCPYEEQCLISYELGDSWGDGWNGNTLTLVDVLTQQNLITLTLENGYSSTGVIPLCNGRDIDFVWAGDNYSAENSFTFYTDNGEIIYQHQSGPPSQGVLTTYTMACDFSCNSPTGLEASEILSQSAVVSWISDATVWNIDVNGTVTAITKNPYTLTGLIPSTAYTVKVQADCGNNNLSEWTDAFNFTTLGSIMPTDVVVNYNGDTEAVVSWISDATSWNVNVNGTVTNVTETSYTITGIEPNTLYTVKVQASYIDGSLSDWTDAVNFIAEECPDGKVCIGSCINTNRYLPTFSWHNYSLTQQIYTADEIGTAGTILSVDFHMVCDGNKYRYMEIYMVHTDKETFENGSDWISVTSNDRVYSGYVTFNNDAWTTIEFDTPFVYDGTSNVALIVNDKNGSWGTTMNFYAFNATSQAIYVFGDYPSYNPTNPTYNGYVANVKNRVRFTFEEPVECETPGNLSAIYNGFDYPTISWTSDATAWNIDVNGTVSAIIDNPYTLTNLEPNTFYEVKVQANCGGGRLSDWTDVVSFTTATDECPKPTNLSATFQNYNADTLKWTGENITYNLRYRTAESAGGRFFEDFEHGLANWTVIDADGDGYGWVLGSESKGIYHHYNESLDGLGHDGSDGFVTSGSYTNYGEMSLSPDNYLVSPKVPLGGFLYFWACAQDFMFPNDHFGVAVSTISNCNPEAFTTIAEWTMTVKGSGTKMNPGTARDGGQGHRLQGNWYRFSVDLSAYLGEEGYIAIRHFGCNDVFMLNIDDIYYTGAFTIPAGEWHTINGITDTQFVLDGLEENTNYEFQVQGICEGNLSDWSTTALFSTYANEPIAILDGGYWNEPETWVNNGGHVPEPGQNVTIAGDVIIGTDLTVTGDITIAEGATLTIGPGVTFNAGTINVSSPDQLILTCGASFTHTGEVLLTIALGYNATNGRNGEYGEYRLIASPVTSYLTVNSTGLVPGSDDDNYDYVDLYYFDQSAGDNVWINYKDVTNHFFNFDITKGYLYSNAQNVTGVFAGKTLPTNVDVTVNLEYVADAPWAGWNLVGNPFTCMAYIDRGYYKIDGSGMAIASIEGNSLEVFEGVFVVATAEEDNPTVTFTTTQPQPRANLTLNLSNDEVLIDRAIVRFDEGRQLPKFQLNANQSKVYIQQDGVDYAIVNATDMGEIPISFKAERNDNYTLGFSSENVGFNYLHLIDNKTGADVDLLATSSYSFEAKTTDYASRFKLVFATGNNTEDNFVFFSNGNFIISNEGEATLQVIDVNGRILKSESINGSASVNVNAAAGVYMLRLVNGDNVKVQKVVIK